jgi:phosphatidylserine decarboxylase
VPPIDRDIVVSPADGKVVVVRPLNPQDEREGTLVSIFLSVFDVHVNRSPLAGTITGMEYRRGRFMIATNHQASVENEQNVVTVETEKLKVTFKQIAGVIARRIVFALGESVGLIKFGSRTDLLLPPSVAVEVKPGDRVRGGVTIIGRARA